MRKFKRFKLLAFTTAVLSAISIMSTGFASWWYLDIEGPNSTANITLTSYDVQDMGISITDMDVFSFSALSFKNDSNGDSNTGQITVHYSISQETLAALQGNSSINIELTYQDATGKLFSSLKERNESDPNQTKTFWVSADSGVTITDFSKEGEIIKATCDIPENSSGNLTFTVTYYFSLAQGEEFHNNFGKYIYVTQEPGAAKTTTPQPTKFIARAQLNNTT